MDSSITVKIVEPGSVPVPDTGLFTGSIGGGETAIIATLVLTIAAIIIAAIIIKHKRTNKDNDSVNKTRRVLPTFLSPKSAGLGVPLKSCHPSKLTKGKSISITLGILAIAISLGTFTLLMTNTNKSNTSAVNLEEDEEDLSATVDNADVVIELSDEPVFAVVPVRVTVTEDMPVGYTLKAYSKSPTLSAEGTDKTISLVTIPEDDLENAGSLTAALTDNTWGLAVEEPESEEQEIYFSLPETADEAVTIATVEDTEAEDSNIVTVYYGIYITPDMPYGEYAGATVSYEVEPNRTDLATVTFDSNGLYFDDNESKTTNVVRYEKSVTDITEMYSHTPNINDEGVQNSGEMYPIGLNKTFVYEFADAEEVKLHLVKMEADGTCGPNTDQYFSFWQGNHANYTAVANWETGEKVSGSNGKYPFASGSQYAGMDATVSGNALTLAYTTSDHRGDYCGNSGYGYYAVITATDADGNPAYAMGNVQYSGAYKTPATTAVADYEFLGWSTDPNATSVNFTDGDDVTANLSLGEGESVTLYAVWSPIVDIVYNGNNATAGSMESTSYNNNEPTTVTLAHEDVIAGNDVDLFAPNYKKTGYGFAGWSTDANAWNDLTDNDESNDPTIYGPNQSFTMTKDMALAVEDGDMTLYAVWVPAEQSGGTPVTLQNWTGCSALTATTYNDGVLTVGKNTITALTDSRDNNVYTVARLADGNCWMIENLRLDNTATISTTNTNNPVVVDNNVALKNNDGNTSNHLSPTSNSWCTNSNADCYNQSYLNTFNTNLGGEGAIASYNGNSNNSNPFQWYSYGSYYNWYSATAGNGKYETGGSVTVEGDICPAGWGLPIGNQTETNGSFSNLDTTMGGTGSYQSSSTASNNWRSFPNNFVYSGSWYGSSAGAGIRGVVGVYWSSTANDTNNAYYLSFGSSGVNPTYNNIKFLGFSVRCVAPAL